jgi:hypothetical protein
MSKVKNFQFQPKDFNPDIFAIFWITFMVYRWEKKTVKIGLSLTSLFVFGNWICWL